MSRPKPSPILAALIAAAFFVYSDVNDRDSWDTQIADFRRQSHQHALTLLQGEDAAIRSAIEEAVHDKIRWLVPAGMRLALAPTEGNIDLASTPYPGRPP